MLPEEVEPVLPVVAEPVEPVEVPEDVVPLPLP